MVKNTRTRIWGGVVLGIGILMIWVVWKMYRAVPEDGPIILASYFFMGFPFLVLGGGLLWSRREIRITDRSVLFLDRAVGRDVEWEEPVASFHGILFSRWDSSGSSNDSSPTSSYLMRLIHPDKAKCVDLLERIESAVGRNWEAYRKNWEALCRLVNLPALEWDGKTDYFVRQAADLDVPLGALIREGKAPVGEALMGMIPRRIRLIRSGGGVEIRFEKVSLFGPPLTLLLMAVLCLVVALGGSLGEAGGAVLMVIGGLFLLNVPTCLKQEQKLSLDAGWVRVRVQYGNRTSEISEETRAIESVTFNHGHDGKDIVICSDRQRIQFGKGMSRQELEWCRDCILASLARW